MGLGGIIKIPQQLLADAAGLATSLSLLWTKSPPLVVAVYGAMVMQQVALSGVSVIMVSSLDRCFLARFPSVFPCFLC
jgi:hypothetical protein